MLYYRHMKNTIIVLIALLILVLISFGIYFWIQQSVPSVDMPSTDTSMMKEGNESDKTPGLEEKKEETVIGKSFGGHDIVAYHYGTGDTEILLVGGIHGGYEWNTTLVAYEAMDYLKSNPDVIPENVMVTVIPVLNPDGLLKVVDTVDRFTKADVSTSQTVQVAGRFNGNDVDLNRNFDCDWQAKGTWQNKAVSGGSKAFSEPESQAIKNYVDTHTLSAVVVWYSAAGGVFASNCHNGILAETSTLTNLFAKASGYPAYEDFDFYEVTGDMVNWLAKEKIPAMSVLLTNHTSTEWTKNQAGIDALLKHYTK